MPLHQHGISYIPDAIAFVLRSHDFRAGRFRIGYQSCDDSTAKQGELRAREVQGECGPVRSARRASSASSGRTTPTARAEQLAITNRAGAARDDLADEHGARADQAGARRRPAGTAAAELYPTGRRHYARLLGTDGGQGAALALFAHERGVRRLAIVQTDDEYGRANAWYAAREARRLGIRVTGVHTLDVRCAARRPRERSRRASRGNGPTRCSTRASRAGR